MIRTLSNRPLKRLMILDGNGREILRGRNKSGGGQRVLDVLKNKGIYSSFGYHSARVLYAEGRSAQAGSSEYHYRYDRENLINQSRQFMRDNGIYRGMIERACGYIIGNGFGLQVKSKNKNYNATVEELWRRFWARPEVKRVISGRRVERMICREVLVAGDTAALKVKIDKERLLQLIEAEQIVGPAAYRDGIKKDLTGKPTEFLIGSYGKTGYVQGSRSEGYKAEDVIYITEPERPSGIRGVPPCQSSFPMLHRIQDVCDAEAIAWQMIARLAVSITREDAAVQAFDESRTDPNKSGDETEGDLATRLTELDYALIFHGEPGEKVEGIGRNIPGKNFSESLMMFLRLLGLPIGLPLEVILLDWTKSNYSQSRAILEQAYQVFLGWQYLIEDFFHNQVLDWKMREWESAGIIKPRKDTKISWIKPAFPWIDQLKEAQAYGVKMERGIMTHAQVCKTLNMDREDVVTARQLEIEDAIERSQAIKAKTGIDVPWEYFAGLKVQKQPTGGGEVINKEK